MKNEINFLSMGKNEKKINCIFFVVVQKYPPSQFEYWKSNSKSIYKLCSFICICESVFVHLTFALVNSHKFKFTFANVLVKLLRKSVWHR